MKRERYKLNKDIFVERFRLKHGDKYDYTESNYVNQRTKVKIICPIHGEFWQTPKNHMKGQGCDECGKEYAREWRKYKYQHFVEESKKRFGDVYLFPNIENEYENSHSIITLECKLCGNVFHKIACDHLTSPNGGCSHYEKITSKLENEIENELAKKNISFIKQKKFKETGMLEMDFYLPEHNVIIECQGIQHFSPVERFGGNEEFERILDRDNKKKEFCRENNIKLLYYSNLGIDYPYEVFEDKKELLKEIVK